MNYDITKMFDLSDMAASPPPGARNVRRGEIVEGPGGKWVPCATKVAPGVYFSSLFQIGPGQRQVCVPDRPMKCAEMALLQAITLATYAAA
jgi:hypothetical protein